MRSQAMRHVWELSKLMRVRSDFKGFKVVLKALHDFAWLHLCSPYITPPSRHSIPIHVPLPSTMPTILESKAHLSKSNHADPFRRIWVGFVEVCNKVWSIDVPFQKPQVFFMPIPLPLHQELQLSIVELIINHLFDLIPFLPFYDVQSGGGLVTLHLIRSGGTGMSLTTWKTRWICDIDGESLRWYACEPTGWTIGYGPRYRCANFFVGLVVLISEASRKTFLPTVNFGAGVCCWL